MLSDAEIREYEIKNERAFIEKYKRELESGQWDNDPIIQMVTIDCLRHAQEKLVRLEAEAADELGCIKEIRGNNQETP